MSNSITWHDVIGPEKSKSYFKETLAYVAEQRKNGKVIYPAQDDVFNAFKYTELSDIKVVILGQDPYHGPGQAHGLSYALPSNMDEKISSGKIMIANVSRRVLEQVGNKYSTAGAKAGIINISARPDILAQRLASRGRESEQDIARRLAREVPIKATRARLIEIDNSGSLAEAGKAFVHAVRSFA